MGFKRRRAKENRTVYVAARISEQSKHYLDVLSLLHQESYSSIVERGIAAIARERLESGGSRQVSHVEEIVAEHSNYDEHESRGELQPPAYKTYEQDVFIDVAEDTWSPHEWLRRLKMSLIAPELLPAAEKIFWAGIQSKKDDSDYWLPASHDALAALSEDDRDDLGNHVLKVGVPVQERIRTAWQMFSARP
jgi:hypothetical protein